MSNTSFAEMMGLPNSQLDNIYWLPWYNNVDLDTQLRFGNVSSSPATVHVYIGGHGDGRAVRSRWQPGESTRKSFAGINSGPVKIVSNANIVAAERVIYKVNGVNTSFTEMMALAEQPVEHHLLAALVQQCGPGYPAALWECQRTQPATVHVYIGGVEMAGSPFTLAAGASTRKSFAGINGGPVKIVSNHGEHRGSRAGDLQGQRRRHQLRRDDGAAEQPVEHHLLAALVQQCGSGYPAAVCQRPAIRTATVQVYIGGAEMQGSPFTLAAGREHAQELRRYQQWTGADRERCPNIVAAERVIYKVNNIATSFSEMMGLPNSLLNTTYWLPWYNNVDLDTQFRFGVP